MKHFIKTYAYELSGAIFCIVLGMLSGASVSVGKAPWYETILKPSFNPPDWIFGPVWFVLYAMMGVALGMLLRKPRENRYPLVLFVIQLALNLIWSPVFFSLHRIDVAFLIIVLLWIAIVLLMLSVIKKRTILLLFLPYLLWVSFAAFLNYHLLLLNG